MSYAEKKRTTLLTPDAHLVNLSEPCQPERACHPERSEGSREQTDSHDDWLHKLKVSIAIKSDWQRREHLLWKIAFG